ncbi:MAG: (d)CMP kinase [Alphaproteobacteria bacterium]|nr:(d)CMP kinase [Alphaproteobacteria bacterium]
MIIIAIDGPSGAGKGTIAGYLAQTLQFAHIDSGLLYRRAALTAIDSYLTPENITEKNILMLVAYIYTIDREHLDDDSRLRLEETASMASKLSALPTIRNAVNAWLHKQGDILSSTCKGMIVDGRDIGTVVFPNASIKFYVTADESARIKRRFKDTDEDPDIIARHMVNRDKRDSTRKTAPLSIATDAIVIDTTHLSIDEACKNASEYVTERFFRV